MPCSLPVLSPYLQCVIDAGAVEALFLLISEPKSQRDIVKEACWTLSNIAAGSLSQISAVLESGCVEHVVMLANDVRDHHTVTFVMRDEWGCGVIEVVVIGWVAIGCHWQLEHSPALFSDEMYVLYNLKLATDSEVRNEVRCDDPE